MFLLIVLMMICGQAYSAIHTVHLGDTPVQIIRQLGKGKTFVHLHENERTALKAAKLYVNKSGGTIITLKHSGQRNIVFHLHKVQYQFDPNRIFTDRGIKKTLMQFGHYSPEAHRQVKLLANQIIKLIPPGKVIAVHNNQGYSLKDYLPKHSLARDIKAINYQREGNLRNFYFVTRQEDFQRLKQLKFNVALQAKHVTDDGSLSVYYSGRSYINIESAHGQLAAQLRMIDKA